jgi:hypothetical protein
VHVLIYLEEKEMKSSELIAKFQYALDNKWGYIWGTAGVQWTQAKQTQKVNYMVNKYGTGWKNNSEAKSDNYYYAAKEGSKWIGHMVADCSGLFVWAFKQYGQSIYHGSNSIWNRYCTSKGEITASGNKQDGSAVKPGSAVFVYRKEKDNRSHIGLYIGGGVVIEAAHTGVGVITSKITDKKWVEWGELTGVTYEGGDEPLPDVKPTLKKGDHGPYVKEAQEALLKKGYDIGRWGADGKFGAATEDAVRRFQRDAGLTADGVIGEDTWKALEKDTPVTILYTVTIPHLTEYQAEALVKQHAGATKTEERW